MNRFWFGAALLVLLLGIGIGSSLALDALHAPISRDLTAASQEALEERWDVAADLAIRAKDRWERQRHGIAAVSSHSPMEQIDCLFAELELYLQEKEAFPFAVCCASLSAWVQALAEAHAMSWWNLL